jgi:hypothetical protein
MNRVTSNPLDAKLKSVTDGNQKRSYLISFTEAVEVIKELEGQEFRCKGTCGQCKQEDAVKKMRMHGYESWSIKLRLE